MSDNGKKQVLVIGAGISGMEASLLLSRAGVEVHLIESKSYTGGMSILFEEVFPNLECATCMLAPRQQELLQDANVSLQVYSEVESVEGGPGRFKVKVKRKARYVDPAACIGCGACYDPCPVSTPNEEEMGLSQRKAIFIPFPGALPNVPVIDKERCLHLNGEDCQACQEACVFGAVDFNQKDEVMDLEVDAIIVATGSVAQDLSGIAKLGYGSNPDVYTALEFERLRSSNGPSLGTIVTRAGKIPRSVALVHCAGRAEKGYCSSVCCMYLAKFNHYLRSKAPGVEVHEYFTDLCIPGPGQQRFFMRMMEGGTDLVRYKNLKVEGADDGLKVIIEGCNGGRVVSPVDMVVLAPPLEPRANAGSLARVLGISIDQTGFFASPMSNSVASSRAGVYVVGSARGPMSMEAAVADALAAVAEVLADNHSGD